MSHIRFRLHALVGIAPLCMTVAIGCGRSDEPPTPASAQPAASPPVIAEPNQAPPTANPAVAEFKRSLKPALQQLTAMRLRTQNGITPTDFRRKHGEILDALAQAETLPTNDARRIIDLLKQAADSYDKSTKPWTSELTTERLVRTLEEGEGSTEKPDSLDETKREELRRSLQAALKRQRGELADFKRAREQLWEAANDATEQARTAIDELR